MPKNEEIEKHVNIMKNVYYIDSLHRVKYFKPLFLEIWMIVA